MKSYFSLTGEINQMKKLIPAISLLALVSTHAEAQSSVTLYGVVDESLRYITGADSQNHSSFSLTNGAVYQSRFGMKGNEDLGGGLSAVFDLESGVNASDGTTSRAGTLFNRYAYVGLSSTTYGTLTLGNRLSPLYENLTDGWDPLTVGNYLQNEWAPVVFSGDLLGSNNGVTYGVKKGPFTVALQYGFGNQAGSLKPDSRVGGSVIYEQGIVGMQVGFDDAHDQNGFRQNAENVTFRLTSNPWQAWLGYFNSYDQTGLVDAALTGDAAVESSSTPRRDNAFFAGLGYQITPAVQLTAAAYYDLASNVSDQGGNSGDGQRYTLVALAEYFLSKRTHVYATVDYNRVHGSVDNEMPNGREQLGVGLGLGHFF
jgi:predicted porin